MSAKRNILLEVLTLVLIIRLGSSATLCENHTVCNQMGSNTKCCNGTCLQSCNITTACKKNNDCATGEKCCGSGSGKCISQMSLCSLSSKLAIAIPLSLLFSFALLLCICTNHSSCPVYANQQRRRLGVV